MIAVYGLYGLRRQGQWASKNWMGMGWVIGSIASRLFLTKALRDAFVRLFHQAVSSERAGKGTP